MINDVLNKKICDCGFSLNLIKILNSGGFYTIKDVSIYNDLHFIRFERFGKKCLTQLQDFFLYNNLEFGNKFGIDIIVTNKCIKEILEEKGFYKDLDGSKELYYKKIITHQNVTDWLYEKGISLEIYTCSDSRGKSFNHLIRKVGRMIYEIRTLDNKCVTDRYEAWDKGIMEALKLIN